MKQIKEPSIKEGQASIAISIRKADKINAIITGCFFIAATVSAIIGLSLYDPILNSTEYLDGGASYFNQIVVGAVFEMILVASNCGTAIMLFSYLKAYNQQLAFGYFTFRILESVFILLGIVSILSLLTFTQSYTTASSSDQNVYYAIGTIAKAFHDWTFILGPKFMLGINTFIYSYVFFRTELVPKKLALLGLTGACLIFINALLEMFGVIGSLSVGDFLFAFPIAIYEMILAVWLITKGFRIYSITNIK